MAIENENSNFVENSVKKLASYDSESTSALSSIADAAATKTSVFLTNVKTFVAGILMPTIRVTISSSFNAVPRATVTLPSDPRLFNIGECDRVPIHIFVQETVAENPKFVLLFDGFVDSKSYISIVNQREIDLTCVGWTSFFEDVKFKFMTTIHDVARSYVPGQGSANGMMSFSPLTFPSCLFFDGLASRMDARRISKPTQYLANIIEYVEEAARDDFRPANALHNSLVSKYYSTLAYNLHLDRRFCWVPYFDLEVPDDEGDPPLNISWQAAPGASENTNTMFPVLYGLQTDFALKQLAQGAATSSAHLNIKEMLDFLLAQIEYDFLVIPNAAFHSKQSNIPDEGLAADDGRPHKFEIPEKSCDAYSDNQWYGDVLKDNQEKIDQLAKKYSYERNCDRLVNFCLKPLLDDAMPPMCNVIFRSQVDQINGSFRHNRVPTRIQTTGFIDALFKIQKAQGQNQAGLLTSFATTEFYPSKYYNKDSQVNPLQQQGSDELLDIEKYTGPWIHEDKVPPWFSYMMTGVASGANGDIKEEDIKALKERYMRRQLTRARYAIRQLTVVGAFNPYVTVGFPGVVFDSADSGFAFAGNVVQVDHSINTHDVSTTVTLSCVRLLSEAALQEENGGEGFPNPVNAVHVVTHEKHRMDRVYASILGTPDVAVAGAEAMTYSEILNRYGGPVGSTTASPQNNIYEAYRLQRRNICTLQNYCSFMDISPSPSSSDPTILSSDFINDRAKIKVFDSVPLLEIVKPSDILKELIEQYVDRYKSIEAKNDEIDKKNAEKEKQELAILEDQRKLLADEEFKKTHPEDYEKLQKNYAKNLEKYKKNQEVLANNRKTRENNKKKVLRMIEEAKKKYGADKDKKSKDPFISMGMEVDVRDVLMLVQHEAMSGNVY